MLLYARRALCLPQYTKFAFDYASPLSLYFAAMPCCHDYYAAAMPPMLPLAADTPPCYATYINNKKAAFFADAIRYR